MVAGEKVENTSFVSMTTIRLRVSSIRVLAHYAMAFISPTLDGESTPGAKMRQAGLTTRWLTFRDICVCTPRGSSPPCSLNWFSTQ